MLARPTVVFDSRTGGSNRATGVSSPNLPIENSTPPSLVTACSASNLYALTHRGTLAVAPSRGRWANSFTFTTIPSVS